MVDLFRKQLISEKVDIWALGCLLYKMAYGCDAFEEGSLQILNNKWSIPKTNAYSGPFTDLIAFMLVQDPAARPHIGQVLSRVAALLKKPNPLASFKPYDHGSHSAAAAAAAGKTPTHPMSTLRVSSGPKHTVPTAAPPPAPAKKAPAAASSPSTSPGGGSGGGDLFAMLDWEQDEPGARPVSPQPKRPVSPQQQQQDAAAAFDFFGGQQGDSFAMSASPAPAAPPPPMPQGQGQGASYDFFADFGAAPAAASPSPAVSMPAPAASGVPRGSVSPGFVGSGAGSLTGSKTSTPAVGMDFFADDNNSFFNSATPVLQPQSASSPKPGGANGRNTNDNGSSSSSKKGKKVEEPQMKKSAEDIQADVYSNWLN